MKLGVIFDLDGALVDDGRFHFEAWSMLARKIGVALSESVFHSFNGLKNEDVLSHLLGREIGPALAEVLGREKDDHYRALYRPHLAPVAGANEFLARLRSAGTKIALATSSAAENRALILDGLGWSAAFDAVVVAEGLPGKPEPDIHLGAANALGVPPSECLVFDATWNGVKAATRAGMSVIGVTTNVEADVLLRGGAAHTIANYTELPANLEELVLGP